MKHVVGKLGNPPHDEGGFIVQDGLGVLWLEWILPPHIAGSHQIVDGYIESKTGRRVWFIFTVSLDPGLPDEFQMDLVARKNNISIMKLIPMFSSNDVMERAQAWAMVGKTYGWSNLDDKWEEEKLYDLEDRYGLPHSPHSEPKPQTIDTSTLDEFTQGFIEAMLFAGTDESNDRGGHPLDDNYGSDDLADDTLKMIIRDCEAFQQQNAADLALAYQHPGYDEEHAGHDFLLTRDGHGAGFWDRGLGAVGDRLTNACKPYGNFYVYIGDDDMIHAQ